MATQVEFDYDMARFISFRDREACERVRTDHARGADRRTRTRSSGSGSSTSRRRSTTRSPTTSSAGSGARATRATTFVAILPVGPMPQYELAARMINEERLSLAHVHTFNMDEYANEDGVTAPLSWPGSFQRAMLERLLRARSTPSCARPTTRSTSRRRRRSPTTATRIEALGGADVCYGGIGWCGHIAFWESHLGEEFDGDLEAYKQAGARLVELHPMTIMQNALHSFGGDWSWVPPKANTIGPREILGARHRSFWLDGDLGGGVSWQRFIARLVAHGPVSEFVPGSILQTAPTDYTILGGVADDVEIHMA